MFYTIPVMGVGPRQEIPEIQLVVSKEGFLLIDIDSSVELETQRYNAH